MSNKKKIELYLDGPTFQEIKDFKNIDGYTFNPSLYKKLKAENYIEPLGVAKILKKIV